MSKSNKQSWPQTTPTSLIPPIFRSKDCRINSRSAGPRTKMVRSTRNHHHHHHSFHYSINHLSILNHTIHHPQRNKHKKESKLRIVLQLHYQQNGKYNDRNTKQDHEHFIYKLHPKHERMISQIRRKQFPRFLPRLDGKGEEEECERSPERCEYDNPIPVDELVYTKSEKHKEEEK